MNTEEHLKRIKVKCRELLAIAEKRTPGRWDAALRADSHDIVAKDEVCGGVYLASVTGKSWGGIGTDDGIANAEFIATCAGPAEAGWRATIAAIDWIASIRHTEGPKGTYEMLNNILAAWPEELL